MPTETKGNALQERSRARHWRRRRRGVRRLRPRLAPMRAATGQQQSPRRAMGNGRACPLAPMEKTRRRDEEGAGPPFEAAANSFVPVRA